jgi:membrane protein implicated in regulation of membrane protease activity
MDRGVFRWLKCHLLNAGVITLVLGIALTSLQGTAGLILMALLVVALKRVIDKERAQAWAEAQDLEEARALALDESACLRSKPETNNKEEAYW